MSIWGRIHTIIQGFVTLYKKHKTLFLAVLDKNTDRKRWSVAFQRCINLGKGAVSNSSKSSVCPFFLSKRVIEETKVVKKAEYPCNMDYKLVKIFAKIGGKLSQNIDRPDVRFRI